MDQYKNQMRNAILEKMCFMKHMHKRDIKAVIDEIKNDYILSGRIRIEELLQFVSHLKQNWTELKEQARGMRRLQFGI